MNRKQRIEYSKNYISMEQRIENAYVGPMRKAISNQVKQFIIDLKIKGLREAETELRLRVYDPEVTRVLEKMYKNVTPRLARFHYNNVRRLAREQVKKEATAAFGFSESWNYAIIDFLSQHLLQRATVPVTETTKKLIMDVLEEGQQNGWSVERIIAELAKVDQMSAFRARRIIRTELAIASNFGFNLARQSVEFKTRKEWITAHDERVRPSHKIMDGVVVESDDTFSVPVYKGKKDTGAVDRMTAPGDPEASGGNVINCRCTVALIPVRDENDNLIPIQPLFLTTTNNNRHVA